MTITQVNSQSGRYYDITLPDGFIVSLKSVTTLIKNVQDLSFLEIWKKNVGEEEAKKISETSSKRGDNLHEYIKDYFQNGNLPIYFDEYKSEYDMFTKLQPLIQLIEPIEVEEKIYWYNPDTEMGFAGSVDIVGKINSKYLNFENSTKQEEREILFVGDWKTWNKPKESVAKKKNGELYFPLITYCLQMSAYCAAMNRLHGTRIKEFFIFGVSEDQKDPNIDCSKPFIYYYNQSDVMFYWTRMKQIVEYSYKNIFFDWNLFQQEVYTNKVFGEKVTLSLNV